VRKDAVSIVEKALRLWPTDPGRAVFRAQEAFLLGREPLDEPSLDLGCGNGQFGGLLEQRFTLGVDLDLASLRMCADSPWYAHVIQSDLARLPLAKESFQSAVSNSTLEHVAFFESSLSEAWRVLRPGGVLRLTVPGGRKREWLELARRAEAAGNVGLGERYRDWFDSRWEHRRYLSAGEAQSSLLEAGFRDVQIEEYESRALSSLLDALNSLRVSIRSANSELISLQKESLISFWSERLGNLIATDKASIGANYYCTARK
jgi:SAM-dependent methyltransferase